MKILIKNLFVVYLLIFPVFFIVHPVDDKNPMIQEESMLEAPISGAILDNERKKLEKAIDNTEKIIQQATNKKNEILYQLEHKQIPEQQAAVIIGEQKYIIKQAQIKLAEMTVKAFDKIQSSPQELGYMDRLRAGIGGMYDWMRGTPTQEQKEIAQSVIKQINEQMKQSKENYETGIKFITDAQERDRITENYNKVISDLAVELKRQKLITGEEMSAKEQLFLTTAKIAATIAGGLIIAGIAAKLGQKGYEYFMDLPTVPSPVDSTKVPLTQVTDAPLPLTGATSKNLVEAKPETNDIQPEQEAGLWATIQKAGRDFMESFKSSAQKAAEAEDKEPGLSAEKLYESTVAPIVELGQQAMEKADKKIGEFFAPEKPNTDITGAGETTAELSAPEANAIEGEPGRPAEEAEAARLEEERLATHVQIVKDFLGNEETELERLATDIPKDSIPRGESVASSTQSEASSSQETPKPELTNLEKNKLLMSVNTWKSKLSWLPSEKTLLEKIENAKIQPEKDKLMHSLNERRRIQQQLNEATEKLKP